MPTPENEELKRKYAVIVAKLRTAIARNKAAFPQLTLIGAYLDAALAADGGEEDCLRKLEGLCAYLQELGSVSYVVRHLHHNLCADVEAARSGSVFFNQSRDYISLPR